VQGQGFFVVSVLQLVLLHVGHSEEFLPVGLRDAQFRNHVVKDLLDQLLFKQNRRGQRELLHP